MKKSRYNEKRKSKRTNMKEKKENVEKILRDSTTEDFYRGWEDDRF